MSAPLSTWTADAWRRVAAMAAVAGLVAIAHAGSLVPARISYREGDVAQQTVRASEDLAVVDDAATALQREVATRRAPIVVRVEPSVITAVRTAAVESLAPLLEVATPAVVPAVGRSAQARRAAAAHRTAVTRALEATAARVGARRVPAAFAEFLGTPDAGALLRARVDSLVTSVYATPIMGDAAQPSPPPGGEGSQREGAPVLLITGGQERAVAGQGAVQSLEHARRELRGRVTADLTLPLELEAWVRTIVALALRPNASYDNEATRRRREQAVANVLPVSLTFRRHQVVVAEGELVSRQTVLALAAMRREREPRTGQVVALAILILATLLLSIGPRPVGTGRGSPDAHGSDFWFGLAALGVSGVAFVGWEWLTRTVLLSASGFPPGALVLAFPAAGLAIYARLALGPAETLRLVVAQAVVIGLLGRFDARLLSAALATGAVAATLSADCHRRQCVWRVGLLTGGFAAPLLMLLGSTTGAGWEVVPYYGASGLLSGLLSTLVVLALAPLWEGAFGHVTRVRLVELSSYQQPLLRRLATEAPGTFQHSVSVALLADAATRAAGGDALLVRVGALYHDVGKLAHPAMFVENQRGGNPHDALPPQESARLIIGHVAEGERLATTHRLGRRLQSFIREHHGTSVVRFFLERARTQGGDVDERDFRYDGPTPQSLESAVLMLADQVEATARSLPGADTDALAAMVDRTIMRALDERQFDDAPIAPGQIRQVRDALVAALAGMRHQRVAYPESTSTTR